jgi:SAM-dependent methyltransferase
MPSQEVLDQLYRDGSPLVIRTEWVNETAPSLSVGDVAVLKGERDLRGRSYLEIGVGKGTLFTEVASRGAQVVGVEPGAWGHSLPNVFVSLADLPHDSRFDVIVANDVLEHLESPVAMLSVLRLHAQLSSRLYCRLPNNQSLRARWRKERWNMIRPLGHLHYFSRLSVQKMFDKSGWSVAKAVPSEVSTRRVVPMMLDLLGQGDQWLIEATPTGMRC